MVITIVACLVALLLPVMANVRRKADSVACMANLRHVGMAAIVYAGEHNQTMPTIEPWPSRPVYPANAGAQNILTALQPYGVNAEVLQCRADLTGPNYYAKEGSSFEWCPMANGQNIQAPKLMGIGDVAGVEVTLSQLFMAFDYSNVHNDGANILFGDGHVAPVN